MLFRSPGVSLSWAQPWPSPPRCLSVLGSALALTPLEEGHDPSPGGLQSPLAFFDTNTHTQRHTLCLTPELVRENQRGECHLVVILHYCKLVELIAGSFISAEVSTRAMCKQASRWQWCTLSTASMTRSPVVVLNHTHTACV